jgi:Na+/proline symporter
VHCSVVNEAYALGWYATRWIPAGLAFFFASHFTFPQLAALGHDKGYLSISEVIFARYNMYEERSAPAHVLYCFSFVVLQLPILVYVSSALGLMGAEVDDFTGGSINRMAAVLVVAALLMVRSHLSSERPARDV